MIDPKQRYVVLMADDDADDRMLVEDAFEECGFPYQLRCVEDGEELVNYLSRETPSAAAAGENSLPTLILLDLNMPRKDGREALKEIKSDPRLRTIPVVTFTTSNSPTDIEQLYQLGANSFITKPPAFDDLVRVLKTTMSYWFEVVTTPENQN